ncbi:MAG: autotransporter-associated beta strand repeat-containing protein [Verrucomicrobiaceae bacterium]
MLGGLFFLATLGDARAQHSTTGDWNVNANGNWSTTANWTNLDAATDYPSAIDAVVNFLFNITANRTITLDVAATVGTLNIGDSSGGQSYTISGGTLTFESTSGFSQLNKLDGGGNDTISSNLVLNNELDISIFDISNNQGITLSGIISGGTSGTDTIVFDDMSTSNQSVNWVILNNANTFSGRLVANSGLIRLESNNASAGARGVGNETVARNGGTIDLRDRDFNIAGVDDTEMFLIEGSGTNGLGALRNTAGTANISYLQLTGDATVGGYSRTDLIRHTNLGATAEIAPVLDLGGFGFTKLGSTDFVIHNADIQNRTGATLNIYEGEVRFENNGTLLGGALIDGTTYGNNLDGLTINIAYNRNAYDGTDPTLGSRTSDPYNVNVAASALSGNSVLEARLSFGTYWGTHAANTKVTDTWDNFTVNMNNGVWQREGSGSAGQTFDQIFGSNVVINLTGGGIGRDANGNGNLFDFTSGAVGYNGTTTVYDHPGVTEFQGTFDNTTVGNNGGGFTKRGDRELRLTGDSSSTFDGDVLVKQNTGRYMAPNYNTTSGAPESQYFSMSLAGASGSLAGAGTITVTRWGSLALLNNASNAVYASANNNDRLNDAGFLSLRNGNLYLETDTATANQENFGNVVADFGTNYLFLDTRAGGQFDGSFQSFTTNNNGVLKIYDMNGAHTFGTGVTDDRILVNNTTGINLAGANNPGNADQRVVLGLFGGTLPASFTARSGSAATRTDYTMQNAYAYSGSGIGLMTLDGGYLRPLTASEYNISSAPVAGQNWLMNGYISPTGGNYADRNNYAGRNVTSNIAVNSLTIAFDATSSGQALPTATKDYLIIEQDKTLTISSGIINFASFGQATSANMEAVIRGGYLDMGGGVAYVNSALTWSDLDRSDANWYNFITGNNAFIRSHMTNATDLVKTGRNNLYLETWNNISGNIYVSEQASLIPRHPGALGAGGVNRELQIGGAGNFLLDYGTNITGINIRATNTMQSSTTILRGEGAYHNTWGGDVILDVADAASSSDFQAYYVTARNNGTLSLYGNIYTDHNSNFTDSDAYADPPLVSTSLGEAYTVNLRGQFRDIATGNLSTDPLNATITSVYRTGDSATRLDANHSLRFQMTGHDEGNINVFQQWDATGRLDLNRGYFRLMYDPNAAGNDGTGFLTDGANALIQANEYWTRTALGADGAGTGTYHSHLMLTEPDQIFNWGNLLYVYNNNRNGTLSIGNESESGTAYIGSNTGASYSIVFENQGGDRDLRFLQTRGGTLNVQARLLDNGTGVNSIISVIGPGTIQFDANGAGQSTVERWNFMGGEAIWAPRSTDGSMLGNDRFAVSSAQALFGGGDLTVLGEATANRNFNLTGNVRVNNGGSTIRLNAPTGRTFNLNFGAAAATLTKSQGGTLAFIEEGPGTANISMQATGLTSSGLMSWAVYGTQAGSITDFASNGASGAISAFTGYTTGTAEGDFAGNNVDVAGDVSFTGAINASTLRFNTPASLSLDGQALTLSGGAILITTPNGGANALTGGTLTSGFDADLGGSGTAQDLMIFNWNTGGNFTLGAAVTDNGDKVNLVLGGPGTTVLTANNTYTGDTYLNNGTLVISSESQLGDIYGSVSQLVRVNNGGNGNSASTSAYSSNTGASIIFDTTVAPVSAALATFNSNTTTVTATTFTSGGSGYTTGVWANLDDPSRTTENKAGVWALLDSGNLHFDGGTLKVTDTLTLDGARTLFLGANGGTLDVTAGKILTINGYITSEFSQINSANGYTANHIGGADEQASNRSPDIGDFVINGGGMVILTGAPNNTSQANMYNSYGGITWINEGVLKIASAGSTASGILGTNRSFVDSTIIGANGSLELATSSDPFIYEWLTFRGRGYEGRGTIITTGTARTVRLNGQLTVEADMLINNANNSTIRFGENGGALYGTGNIARTGNGEFQFYVNGIDWTGQYLSGSGNTRMYGAGSLQGMTGMSLDRNTYFGYGAGSTSIDEFRDRLPDNLAISINGYSKMRFEAGSGIFSGVEKVGVATVNGGVFGIEFDLGTDYTGGTTRNQGDYAAWHFSDIVRMPGSVVQVRNLDASTDISGGVTDLLNRALVLVDTAPTMVGTGDGTNGNTPVIPGFFGGTRPTFLNTSTGLIWDEDRTSRFLMTSVVGIDPVTGATVNYLRPLSDAPGSTDYTVIDSGTMAAPLTVDLATAGLTADQNLRLIGITDDTVGAGNGFTSRVNSILTLNSVVEVNSVTFATDATAINVNNAGNDVNLLMRQGGSLKIDSGMLLFTNTGRMDKLGAAQNTNTNLDINNFITGGTLDFNGREAIIYAGSEWMQYNTSDQLNAYRNTDGDNTTVILRTSIMNAVGLTKTGASSVTLEGANNYTGQTTVNMGNLYARHDFALGQSTQMNVTGAGNFILGNTARIFGVDLYVGPLIGNNLALYAENEGNQWGGNVIIDNVDAAGSAGAITRNFVPRIEVASSNTVFFIDGNIYGGDTPVGVGAQGTARMFSTYTGAVSSVLDIRGAMRDKSTGAVAPGNLNEVLRMEVVATNDLATVHLYQQYDSAGRIQLVRGVLRYMGDGNFYTNAAVAALNPDSDLSGLQMGGRAIFDGNQGIGSQDVAFFMHNAGSAFNLSSWNVGVDTADPDNVSGNSNYGFGNTTGNSSIGGENTSGTITFGTGDGSIRFTQADTLYDRNLNLYAARGGTVDMKVNFLDGGNFVNSSITKVGAGTMNLLGSSAGDSTVEALKMLGGTLVLTGYDVNANRRVGNGAALTLSGGYLIVDANSALGPVQEDFGDFTLNSGGSRLAVRGNATVNINSSVALTPASGVTMAFVENNGGVINISASGMTTTDGDRFGYWAVYGNVLGQITDWAAREGTTGVKAFTAYDLTFASGNNTEVTGNAAFGADTATNSIKFGAAADLDLGTHILTVENGGMLVSNAVGGAVNIINGTLTRSGAGDILLHNYGTGVTTISANIVDNGGQVSLVTGGVGTTVLGGTNTYTGDTYINGGVLQISSDSQLGTINGSIVRLVREANGSNANNGGTLIFSTANAPTTAATGTYAGSTSVTSTTLTGGGSGYTTGIHVSPNSNPNNTDAGIWAILDSGNLHLDGGTLAVKDNVTLDGARTIFLGASGGVFNVDPGKSLTINGYITSDVTNPPTDDIPTDFSRPLIGGMVVDGGGTVILTGAPDNVIRANMFNGYNALTMINNGTLQLSGAGSTASNALGTYGGWVDSTYIGANGTLMFNTTSDPGFYEWLTLDGQGYQGGGVIQAQGTARSYYLRGQVNVVQDAVFNLRNGSNLYMNNGGGEVFGSGDIIKIGTGEFRFYGNIPYWTGAYIGSAGASRVYGVAGHVQGMTSMTLERNTYFSLESSATTVDEFRDRLPDNMPIFTNGYIRMRQEAGGGVFSGIEKTGTLNLMGGQLGLEFDLGSTLVGGAPNLTNDYAGWHFTEIVRNANTLVQLRNFDAGTDFADSTFNTLIPSSANENRAVVQVDVMPTLIGTGDGTNGNAPVLPGFFGGTRPAWVNLAGTGQLFNEDYTANRIVTVDTNVNGEHFIRPLLDSEYKVISNPDTAQTTSITLENQGITADQNLKIVGVISDTGIGAGEFTNRRNSILTLGSLEPDCNVPAGTNLVINSLTFASESFVNGAGNGRGNYTALMIGDGDSLTINSGMIAVFNTGIQNMNGAAYNANTNLDIRSAINGGSVNMNGQEAIFNIGSIWVHYNTSDAANAYRATDFDSNYLFMNSSITNAVGLTKSGGASLFLHAPNYYTGDTATSYGAIYARHDQALGLSTKVLISGYGTLIPGLGARISGVDLYVGDIGDNRTALQLENSSVWAGNVIIDNVDSAGATSYARTFTPRIFNNYTGMGVIEGNIYGGTTPIGSGALTDSRMFSTYTGAFGLLNILGQVRDTETGPITGLIDITNQSQVLRMEVTATNDESAVQISQQYDAAGRIRIIRGSLYYGGTGNFYTAAAAATVNAYSSNPMIGLQMGGRDVVSGNGTGGANLAFFLMNAGSTFNLNSWEVGVETYDPNNVTGNGNYGFGNTTGNITLGGVNTSGTVTFGTGTGAITFTQGTSSYTRDLTLFAARGGTVEIQTALIDGGSLVNSSITKVGGGEVDLLGSSFGDSTVEGVNVTGGLLVLTGYNINANRRVGNGAYLTLAGGTIAMDGSGASFTENFGTLKINQGGSAIAAIGNGISNFGTVSISTSSITRAAAGVVHFQSIGGGVINFSNAAMHSVTRIGSYATYGANAAYTPFATDWAATDSSGNVIVYTGYGADSFGVGVNTDVQGAGLVGATTNSVRFNDAAGTITSGALTLNDGGILITSNYVGGTPISSAVSVTTPASGTDLLISNFASGTVNFDGLISGGQRVVVSGPGTLAFNAPMSTTPTVINSTTGTNTYSVTMTDTTGLVAGMEVTGTGIPQGTVILSVDSGTAITVSKLPTAAAANDLTYTTRSFTATNTYSGETSVVGGATLAFNTPDVFGSTTGFYLNGRGTLSFTGDYISNAITQTLILGGGSGTVDVSNTNGVLIFRAAGTNQFTSEANNVIAAYGTNNPNAGGLNFTGSGTVQFGDRSAAAATQDLLGVQSTYTGLTVIGDGTNPIRVDIQGQGNDNAQYTVFGANQSWADGTIVRNNATIEFSMKRGDTSRDGQIRIREWFQIGEQAGDQILFDGSTARQPTLDGILNIIGDLTFQTQGNRYGNAGSTGNSEFLINPNEGSVMGTGNIIKLGDGNLRFYNPLHEWTGDLDIQDGFVGLQMNSGAIFNPTGTVYFGDPTSTQTSTIQMRIENRYFGNGTTGLDSATIDLTFNRNIVVRDNIKQEVRIAAGYLPNSANIHFTNGINVGSGSTSFVRFYYEDNVNLDSSLTGHVENTVFDISGNLSGSNPIYVDANNYAGTYNSPTFTIFLSGDNSGYSGRLTVGADTATTLNPRRNAIVRIGSATALGSDVAVNFRNGGSLQIGGMNLTTTKNFLFTGGVGLGTSAGIENASSTAATITFDSGTQSGPTYQDVGVGLRNGTATGYFGSGGASLSVVKIGSGETVFGASTGGAALDDFSNYTGSTLVQEGTLIAGSNNSFSPYSRFVVSSGATLSPYWSNATVGWDVTIGSLAGVAGSLVNVENSTLHVGGDNTTDADFAGVISGGGRVDKVGTGAQTLSGVNTFSGDVGVTQGSLIGVNNSAFGNDFNTIYLGGVTFVGTHPLDARAELLLAGAANAVVNPVTMNAFDGNDQGITIIGTRETSGTYGFATGGTVSLYQDYSTNVFFEADGTSIFQFNDVISDGGSAAVTSLIKIGTGTVELHGVNTYGSSNFSGWSQGTAIDGGTVVRHGTLSIFDDSALSTTVVELGDARTGLTAAALATTSSLITSTTTTFDPASDGAGGAGNGAFLNVSSIIDGVTLGAGDVGKRILVKDEGLHSERNGVYVVVSVDPTCNQMNLVRAADFDEAGEMNYGSSIAITGGTQAGTSFFLGSESIITVNNDSTAEDPVHWVVDHANADVALIAAVGGLTITNGIDVNDTNGTGSTIVGGSFTTGVTYFTSDITLQHVAGVDNVRELTLTSASSDNSGTIGEDGVIFSGIIGEAQPGDTLSVNKTGAGIVTFTGANIYTGKTTVTQGTLALTGSGTTGNTNWIEINSGAKLDFTNSSSGDFTFDGTLSGSGTVVTGVSSMIVGTDGGAGVLRPGMSSDPASIGTAGSTVATFTVDGNLVLTGDTTGADRLTLQMGATAGADYNDAANFTAHLGGGDFATWITTQGTFYDTKTGGSHDRVAVTGSFSMDSGGYIRFTNNSGADYQPVFGDVFNLIDWSSVTANGFDVGNSGSFRGSGLIGDLELPSLFSLDLLFDTSLFNTYGIVVVVPEPGRAVMMLLGFMLLMFRRRRP